ncbi:hypothetical protein N9Y42_05230 [Mariniblastus sp.]|nr:hypothetical protein [Mariniblastus sp.]
MESKIVNTSVGKFCFRMLLSLCLVWVWATGLLAQIAVSNLAEDGGFSVDVTETAYAQSFTTGADAIALFNVMIQARSDFDGSAQMNLRADNFGNPGVLIESLGTATIDVLRSAPLFTPDAPIDLLPNTTYWLTMGEDGSASGSFEWIVTDSTGQTSSFGWTIGDEVLERFDLDIIGTFWVPVSNLADRVALFKIQTEPVPGTPTTFSYTGIVDFDASNGNQDPAPFQAFAGERFTLTYTFDSNTPDCNEGKNGEFVYAGAVSDLKVTVGGNVYTASTGTIRVLNDVSLSDTYRVQADVSGPLVDVFLDTISLSLLFRDSTSSVFSSGVLPLVEPNPDAFDVTDMRLNFESFPDSGSIAVTDVDSGVVLGDVSLDGVVDFSDISPFINVLAADGFQVEADTNVDGFVDFSDIASFIMILSE